MFSVLSRSFKSTALVFSSLIFFAGFHGLANAQSMTQEQIDQMAAMMRSQGQTEAQVEKFIEQMKGVQKFSQELEANQATGMTEEQAARKAAGFSDQEMANMEKMDLKVSKMEKMSADIALMRKQREFDNKYAGFPDTQVILGDKSYVLKTIECTQTGELFSVESKGRPGQGFFRFNANKSSAYGQGGYFESVNFRIGDIDAGAGQQSGELVGKNYTFDELVKATNIDTGEKQQLPLKVSATCP